MFISNVDNLNDIALIESDSSILTYSDLYKNVSELTTFFDDKHLVFIVGENNFATIVCYLSHHIWLKTSFKPYYYISSSFTLSHLFIIKIDLIL